MMFLVYFKYGNVVIHTEPFLNDLYLNFEFLKYGDSTIDFAIRRVGGTAGRLNRKWQECSTSTHYYIRLNGVDVEQFIELYDERVFDTDNTVGPRSISKSELIHVINAIKI